MVSILAPSAAKNEARGGGVQPASPATSADAAAPGGAVAAVADAAAAPAEPLGASGAALAAAGFPGLGGAWLRQATELAAAATAALSALPNSCFAAAPPPPHPGYSLPQRAGAALWTAVLYGALGLVCGGAGQALTNALTRVAPAVGPATLPGVVPVALLWAQYMAFSACACGCACTRISCSFVGQTDPAPSRRSAAVPTGWRGGEFGGARAGTGRQRGCAGSDVAAAAPLQQRVRRGAIRGAHERQRHQPLS